MKEDWVEVEIGVIAKIYNGNSINERLKEEKYKKILNGFNYIGTKDISFDGVINYINGVKIPIDESKFKIAPKDSVLVCSEGGSAGRKTAYVVEDICFGNKLYAITNEYNVFVSKYIYHYTRYRKFFEDFKGQMNGIIGGVSAKKFAEISFPLAPLPEQRAIVAKMEELFSDLDKGIDDLTKAKDQLVIYRQAVLKKALEGGFSEKSIKPKIIKLGSVIDKPKYGTSKKCSLDPSGIAVLRIPNIGFGIINTDELKYASFDENEISALSLREGDILTIRSNGSVDLVGKCAIITKKDLDYLYAGYLIRLRPDLEKIESKFLFHCLCSHNLRIQIESKAKSTSGVNNINSGELESLEIPFFPLQEQYHIVKEIESRLSVCDKVEQSINESLQKAKALRQSILKKAFEGNLLTTVEIERCKKEKDYETAAILLEKIKADKKIKNKK